MACSYERRRKETRDEKSLFRTVNETWRDCGLEFGSIQDFEVTLIIVKFYEIVILYQTYTLANAQNPFSSEKWPLKNCQNLKCPKFVFCTKTSFQRNEHTQNMLAKWLSTQNFRNHEFFKNMQIQKQRSKESKFDKSKVIN